MAKLIKEQASKYDADIKVLEFLISWFEENDKAIDSSMEDIYQILVSNEQLQNNEADSRDLAYIGVKNMSFEERTKLQNLHRVAGKIHDLIEHMDDYNTSIMKSLKKRLMELQNVKASDEREESLAAGGAEVEL